MDRISVSVTHWFDCWDFQGSSHWSVEERGKCDLAWWQSGKSVLGPPQFLHDAAHSPASEPVHLLSDRFSSVSFEVTPEEVLHEAQPPPKPLIGQLQPQFSCCELWHLYALLHRLFLNYANDLASFTLCWFCELNSCSAYFCVFETPLSRH